MSEPLSLAFVSSSRANAFMAELLDVLASELRSLGVDAQVATDHFPQPRPGLAYVVIPHEYFATLRPSGVPTTEQLLRTIALTTEQPGTGWFDAAAGPAAQCAQIADLSTVGVLEWRRRGLAAEHLQLGYTKAWDASRADRERDIDVVVMASINRRRAHYLSRYAAALADHETRLVLAPLAPKADDDPAVYLRERRTALLARSRIALHVRMQRPPYFEWLRAIQALSAGTALLCEHAAGHGPLEPGEHFISGSPENLGLLADALLRDPERLERVRRAGYHAVCEGPSMADAARRLAELAEPLAARPVRPRTHRAPAPLGVDGGDPDIPDEAPADVTAALGAAVRQLNDQLDALAARVVAMAGDRDAASVHTTTPAFDAAAPRVSVALVTRDRETTIAYAIAAVAAQDLGDPFELLILDDGSRDDTLHVAAAALEQRPWLAAQLLTRPRSGGGAAGRHELLRHARGPYVLMLAPHDVLYPSALRRLVVALDATPGAAFAYGVGTSDAGGGALTSYMPWPVQRPAAQITALVRRGARADGPGEHLPTFLAHSASDAAILSPTT